MVAYVRLYHISIRNFTPETIKINKVDEPEFFYSQNHKL
jgi:hypothetical protein